ncbi:MAG: hypothetical protein LBG61_06085 [Burkholderiales bacterium]|nr:hypothetical protein [Burkholderiales bacterium]
MKTFAANLCPHPAHLPKRAGASSVNVAVSRVKDRLELRFCIDDCDDLIVERDHKPDLSPIWQHTCFEFFLRGEGDAYYEYHFAPSGAWGALSFRAYRVIDERKAALPKPDIQWDFANKALSLLLSLELSALPPLHPKLALTSVLEHRDRTLSYWALCHPNPTPDFHDPRGFTEFFLTRDDAGLPLSQGT